MSRITAPDCIILDNWVFEDFILTDEPFPQALQIFEIFVSVNNSLCGELISLLEISIKFHEKVTSVPFLIPNFNLLRFYI